jgi:ribonuclease HI
MAERSDHPVHALASGLHAETDAAAQSALLDLSRAFLGPAARAGGHPQSGGTSHPGTRLPEPARDSWASPSSPPSPSPAALVRQPAQLRTRADGVKVIAPPSLLPGVRLGPATRLDVHPVRGGLVYLSRRLVLHELGDDERGDVHVGLVPAEQLARFWEFVLDGEDPSRPVIVHNRTDEDAATLQLLTALGPAGLNVVPYRLDESADGTQRSSYLLPEIIPEAVLELGMPRIRLADAPSTVTPSGAASDRSEWRRVQRYMQRVAPELLHNMDRHTAAEVEHVFVDGATLRGARLGGAAATAEPGVWAARTVPGATRPVESELEALLLGFVVAAWAGRQDGPVTLHSDSRAALALLRDAVNEPLTLGGARGDRVRRSLRHLLEVREYVTSLGKTVRVRWIKGHVGHQGNELADALARSVARNTLAGTGHQAQMQRLDRIAAAWEGRPVAGHRDCEVAETAG